MFDFHADKQRYFDIQKTVTKEDIIPFIESHIGACTGKHVLEIGCAEAGVLKAFLDHGNVGIGVELSESRFETAKAFLQKEMNEGKVTIINKNIYDITDPEKELGNLFDVIILKDVIEHIPDQERFIPILRKFLSPDGAIFFAYPPWWMPFGGHQQICTSKWLRTLPWFHLLPFSVYRWILNMFNEKEATVKDLIEIKATGINIERIYSILKRNDFKILGELFWLTNPIYKFKFGMKKRKVATWFTKLPFLRNFYTTAHYIVFR